MRACHVQASMRTHYSPACPATALLLAVAVGVQVVRWPGSLMDPGVLLRLTAELLFGGLAVAVIEGGADREEAAGTAGMALVTDAGERTRPDAVVEVDRAEKSCARMAARLLVLEEAEVARSAGGLLALGMRCSASGGGMWSGLGGAGVTDCCVAGVIAGVVGVAGFLWCAPVASR